MEQLKPFIDGVKANRFWIFCGVTLLACVVVYYMVGSSLAKEETAAAGKINQTVNTAKQLQSAGVQIDPEAEDGKGNTSKAHPNDETIAEMEKVVKAAAVATREAWKKKHQTQLDSQLFDKETIREMQVNFGKYLPAESVAFTVDEEPTMLPETVRVNYRDRIREELPKLATLVRSYWKPNYEKEDVTPNEVIVWNEDNQEYWNARFTQFVSEWNSQGAESNVPRTLQVLYTTEDLWLLRSILRDVIGKTVFDKGDIYANDLSVIRNIDHILIGKDAELAASGLPGQAAQNQSPGRSGMASSGKGRGKKSIDDSQDPANGRYVDNEGKDIPAKEYRAIYANKGNADKKKTHWKIAKRVKVRIGLLMDTREIQNLQANCANATFPIEIRSLRVNKHKPSKLKNPGTGGASKGGLGGMGSSKGMGGDVGDRSNDLMMSGGSGARPPGAGGGGATPGSSGSSGAASSGKKGSVGDDQGYYKPVEIYGYIYIYNKVDNSIFKILDDKKTNP